MRKIQNSSFLLLFFVFSAYSQENDFQSWNSIKITKKIYKRTDLSIKQGFRFRENASLVSKNFTDLKISNRIKKTDLSLSLGYRLSNEFDLNASNEFEHRYYLDVSSKHKYKRYRFLLRERLQYQGNNVSYQPLYRQKLEASYNVRKTPFKPFLAFEYFFDFDKFEKLRYTLGFSYPILKDIDLDIFYRIQDEINANNPEDLYILGISLNYKL